MKKRLVFNILILILAIKDGKCIKQSDFCKIGKPVCRGTYDFNNNYKETCEKMKCEGDYKYSCLNGLCSTEKQHCDVYKNLNFLTRPQNEIKFNRVKFVRNVRNCQSSLHDFKLTDICISENNCYFREVFTRLSRVSNFENLVKKQCECRGLYSYKCGDEFCAMHNYACDMFNEYKNRSLNLKKCGNGNQFTQKLFFYPI